MKEVSWLHDFEKETTDIRINRDKEDEVIIYIGDLLIVHLGDGKPKVCLEVQEMTFEEAKDRFPALSK